MSRGVGGGWARVRLLVIVGFLVAFGPLGTDLYLPALPRVAQDLAAPNWVAQLTLSLYLVGIGAGQFVWGPLSDRVGRRPLILLGAGVFAAAAIGCAFAQSGWLLVVLRMLMGFGGSAGVAVGRAVVRDLYDGLDLARIFARLSIVLALGPIVAPSIGAVLLRVTDWRGTFVTLAVVGVVLVVATALWIPETLTAERRLRGRSAERAEAWRAVGRNRQFLTFTAVLVTVTIGFYCYITFISVVLQDERGVDSTQFALLFGLNAVALLGGGQTGAALAKRFDQGRVLLLFTGLAIASSLGVLAASATVLPLWALQAPLFVFVFCFGLLSPLTTGLALVPFARGAGTASAVAGGSQFTLAAAVPAIVAATAGSRSVVMATVMCVASASALAIASASHAASARQATADAIDADAAGTESAAG